MQSNWAAENLQVIRTLMERSALYRRALAPIMLTAGIIGLIAGTTGYFLKIDDQNFVIFWLLTSALTLVVSFLLVRREAIKEKESFWSPPTRRVAHALAPPLLVGLLFGILDLVASACEFLWPLATWALPGIWMILYGCALHSAGFFMQRGIRLLGWIFILYGIFFLSETSLSTKNHLGQLNFSVSDMFGRGHLHLCMAVAFGGLHFAYGVYLYFTEKKSAA